MSRGTHGEVGSGPVLYGLNSEGRMLSAMYDHVPGVSHTLFTAYGTCTSVLSLFPPCGVEVASVIESCGKQYTHSALV